MTDKKTPSGQTRTGVTREKQGPVGGTKRTEVPTNPRLEVQIETSEAEGENKDDRITGADPNPGGERFPDTTVVRRDSVRELGPVAEQED